MIRRAAMSPCRRVVALLAVISLQSACDESAPRREDRDSGDPTVDTGVARDALGNEPGTPGSDARLPSLDGKPPGDARPPSADAKPLGSGIYGPGVALTSLANTTI